jgi:hypothetical protein
MALWSCSPAAEAVSVAEKNSAAFLHGRGSTSTVRWSFTPEVASVELGFSVRTRALRVVSLDKRQECDEEMLICHKNPQECGPWASSPSGPSAMEKGSMMRRWSDSLQLAPAQLERGGEGGAVAHGLKLAHGK